MFWDNTLKPQATETIGDDIKLRSFYIENKFFKENKISSRRKYLKANYITKD